MPVLSLLPALTMLPSRLSLALVLALPTIVIAAEYSLVKEYAGTNFFDDWDFCGNCRVLTTFSLASLKRFVQLTTPPTATQCKLSFQASPRHSPNRTGSCSFTQLRDSPRSSVPTPRVCQLCRKRNHEGGQHHESGVCPEAQHGPHHNQGSVCRWQRVDRGHVTRPVRCKFVVSPAVVVVVSICRVLSIWHPALTQKRDIEGEPSLFPSWTFFTTSGRVYTLHYAYTDVPHTWGLPPSASLVLRLARLRVPGSKLAHRWRDRHIRRRHHGRAQ